MANQSPIIGIIIYVLLK